MGGVGLDLHRFHHIPEGLLEVSVDALDTVLPGPSLIYLKGQKEAPLFVSTLLHGNETTGFYAMQRLLKKYQQKKTPLPRSLLLFVGNVSAAVKGVRHLPEQRDYNRIWSGGSSAEHRLAAEVVDAATSYSLFATIDIHNNTGKNPLYGCINRLEPAYKQLATLFSQTIIYFVTPSEVFSMAFAKYCPSVTIECGQSGVDENTSYVSQYIDLCLNKEGFEEASSLIETPYDLYHTVARVKLPAECTLGFGSKEIDKDISFIETIDDLNFSDLQTGALIGWRHNDEMTLSVIDEDGRERGSEYFSYADGEIRTVKPIIPSMFTKDIEVIHQDCLGYMMERMG